MNSGPPGKPTIQLLKSTMNNLTIQWTLDDDGGSPIRGFLLRLVKISQPSPKTGDDASHWSSSSSNNNNAQETGHSDSGKDSLNDDDPATASRASISKIFELPRASRSFTVEDLDCGSEYSVRISAWNSVGYGRRSESLVARTDGGKPPVPDAKVILDVNSTVVLLHLDRWTTPTCPITKFALKYKEETWKIWSTCKLTILQLSIQSRILFFVFFLFFSKIIQ